MKGKNMTRQEYESIVQKYADHIYRLIISVCKSTTDAEDILQNVFLKLYIEPKDFKSEEHIKRWLIVVAVNESKNTFKTAWRKKVDYLEDLKDTFSFQSAEDKNLYEIVRRLPLKYSCVIHLYYYEGYSAKEISRILQIKESTVLMRMKRGRERLKKVLKEENSDK